LRGLGANLHTIHGRIHESLLTRRRHAVNRRICFRAIYKSQHLPSWEWGERVGRRPSSATNEPGPAIVVLAADDKPTRTVLGRVHIFSRKVKSERERGLVARMMKQRKNARSGQTGELISRDSLNRRGIPCHPNVPVPPPSFLQPPPFPKVETHTPPACTIQGRSRDRYRTIFSISSSAANASVCWCAPLTPCAKRWHASTCHASPSFGSTSSCTQSHSRAMAVRAASRSG